MLWLSLIFLIICIILFVIWYRLIYWPYNYWKNIGVYQSNPYPVFGDKFKELFRYNSFADTVQYVYNIGGNNLRYTGCYDFSKPVLVIKDPDLIKQITIKDFDHFLNHTTFVPESDESIWSNNLFFLKGEKWRNMRAALTPAFTGNKMKLMYTLMEENAEKFVQYFLAKNDKIVTVEMKDAFTRFANDIIANTAFGITCNSLENKENAFFLMGHDLTDFSKFWRKIRIIGFALFPKLYQMFNIEIFPEKLANFFVDIIKSSIKNREQNNIKRPDMINVLMEARKNTLPNDPNRKYITDNDIASQAIVFFFAGFDSVSSLMCFLSHELALHPEIQEKLFKEIGDVAKAHNNKPTYDALTEMKYMEMVISETLRKWPVNALVDRVCSKPYTITAKLPHEKDVHLKEKDTIWLPTYGLHRDPKYFPEPEKFDPERFAKKTELITPYTYLPFGTGQRNCIGARFALLETKVIMFHILLHFELVPIEKTEINLKISTKSFNLTAQNGFWLGLKRRY